MGEAVAFEADENTLSFTLAPELAEALSSYRCAVHGAMMASIEIAGGG